MLRKLVILGILLLIGGIYVFGAFDASEGLPEGKDEVLNGFQQSEFATIQDNSYIGTRLPYFPEFQVLGIEVDETLYEIIKCESSFRPDVCSYAGCDSGQGLAQLIPSTVKYCEKKLGKTINPFDPAQNLECALYLYKNEGIRHWKQSENCWAN